MKNVSADGPLSRRRHTKRFRKDGFDGWALGPAVAGVETAQSTHVVFVGDAPFASDQEAGKHEMTLSDLVFPKGWTRPFTPRINGGLIETARADLAGI